MDWYQPWVLILSSCFIQIKVKLLCFIRIDFYPLPNTTVQILFYPKLATNHGQPHLTTISVVVNAGLPPYIVLELLSSLILRSHLKP